MSSITLTTDSQVHKSTRVHDEESEKIEYEEKKTDEAEDIFRAHAHTFFSQNIQGGKPDAICFIAQAHFPVTVMAQHDLCLILYHYSVHNLHFGSDITNIQGAEIGALIGSLFKNFYEFKASKDSGTMIKMLEKALNAVQNASVEPEDEALKKSQVIFDIQAYIVLFKTNRLDLFENCLFTWFPKEELPVSKQQEQHIGLQSYRYLYDSTVNFFHSYLVFKNDSLMNELNKFDLGRAISTLSFLVYANIIEKKEINRFQVIDICDRYRTLVKDFEIKQGIFAKRLTKQINFIKHKYNPMIEILNGKLDNDSVVFIDKNKNLYKDFIPDVMEFKEMVLKSTLELKELSLLMRNFPFYVILGNFDQLLAKTKDIKTSSPNKFRTILDNEIINFAKDPTNSRRIGGLLKTPAQPLFLEYLTGFARFYNYFHSIELLPTIIDNCLSNAEKCSSLLVLDSQLPKARIRPTRPSKLSVSSDSKMSQIVAQMIRDEQNEMPSTTPTSVIAPSTEISQRDKKTVSFQDIKHNMAKNFNLLQANCTGFRTVNALQNAHVHYEAFLCIMNHLLIRKNESITRQQLIVTVLSSVRHASLAVEQMLAALGRESNHYNNLSQVSAHLSHDLMEILYSCSFSTSRLSPKWRNTIRDINGGEIAERDLNTCSTRGNFVERLLAKTRYLAQEGGAFSDDDVIKDLMNYFKAVGKLYIRLECTIESTKKLPKIDLFDSLNQVKEDFIILCKTANEQLEKLQVSDTAPPLQNIPLLAEIRALTVSFRDRIDSISIKSRLNNILNNLLLQVEVQMEGHDSLQPTYAFLHVSTILLLDQMIAEKYLYACLDILNKRYEPKEIDHNLFKLVQMLGMKEEDFSKEEILFLKRGKDTRMLTRYIKDAKQEPSRTKKKSLSPSPLRKAVLDSISMMQTEPFQNHYSTEEGFKIGDRRLAAKLKHVKEVCKLDIELLAGILKRVAMKVVECEATMNLS